MPEKDRQIDTYKSPFDGSTPLTAGAAQGRQRRPDILRAKDIVPGAVRPGPEDDNISRVDIPQFDLAEDIMAEQRRLTTIRRKGPGGPAPIPLTTPRLSSDLPSASRCSDDGGAFEEIGAGWDPIIADIVARDIQRLCGGAWA